MNIFSSSAVFSLFNYEVNYYTCKKNDKGIGRERMDGERRNEEEERLPVEPKAEAEAAAEKAEFTGGREKKKIKEETRGEE